MLTKATEQLVVEVFGLLGEKAKRRAVDNPEAIVFSMFERVKEELLQNYGRAPLSRIIETASYEDYLKEARQLMEKAATEASLG